MEGSPSPQSESYAICAVTGLRDGVVGGLVGAVFGFGKGLWKRQGFKGSLKDAGSSAKIFALLSGVHTLVSCFLRKTRGKQDAINAGIAGCATGLALSTPGNPEALLRSCITFGAFSYLLERFGSSQPAIAATVNDCPRSYERKPSLLGVKLHFPVLPPFVLAPCYFDGLDIDPKRWRVGTYSNN